jgi:hypothetical protein
LKTGPVNEWTKDYPTVMSYFKVMNWASEYQTTIYLVFKWFWYLNVKYSYPYCITWEAIILNKRIVIKQKTNISFMKRLNVGESCPKVYLINLILPLAILPSEYFHWKWFGSYEANQGLWQSKSCQQSELWSEQHGVLWTSRDQWSWKNNYF